ncbi:MAG TPA: RNA polymerase sigma-70 factor [Bacteroidales bacterium]|jgi:RNA polymerase sigma-70 factor (ECF subfamily)|nr:RNA polymerase sigma-70 factor [Bacteroidales bacterium]
MSTLSQLKEFNKLFNEYNERFIRFACGYVKERLVAEDIVSEAFMTYWENRQKLKPDTNPPAYILTVIKNRCLNYLQRERTRLRVTEELKNHENWVLQTKINTLEACDPDFLFSEELQTIVDATLQQLPFNTRRVFVLSRNHNMSYKEIARTINLSEKSVEFHISKALSTLRVSLKEFLSLLLLLNFCLTLA